MRCPDVRDLLHCFLDGELDVDRNVAILKHLEMCPPCRQRSELEQTLRGAVVRACCEKLPPERCRALLDAACCAPVAPRRTLTGRRVLVAAAVLLVAGAGVAWKTHLACRIGNQCRARKVLALARETALLQPPRRLEDLASADVRRINGLTLENWNVVRINTAEVPLLRYRCPEGKEVDLIRVPEPHVHSWDFQRLEDGHDYVVVHDGSSVLVGWLDAEGDLWCVIGCQKSVPRERLEVLASNMRVGN